MDDINYSVHTYRTGSLFFWRVFIFAAFSQNNGVLSIKAQRT